MALGPFGPVHITFPRAPWQQDTDPRSSFQFPSRSAREGFDPGLAGRATSSADDPNKPPDEFTTFVINALWKQGVDVTSVHSMLPQVFEALWNDTFIKNEYNEIYAGTFATDPSTGVDLTDGNFETALSRELFDPKQTHSQYLTSFGAQLLQLSGKQLPSGLQDYAANLGGGNPTVTNAIARAAQETGVPYNVALAVAMAESGLNPKAVGDGGNSHGLFQLNTAGGEGAGLTKAQLEDPYQNALIALREFAAVAQANPSITSDPGAWAAAAQRPADQAAYATRVNNLMQSGFGGSPSSLVPKPFDGNFPITEDHDEGDLGIDYGTPVGTAMYTPFAGTIRLEDSGKSNWGKRAMVVLDNGYTYAVGHLHSFSISDGQRVNPGDILGESGGATDDPSSGISTGPHVELQWISPGGNFLDPHIILDPIFTGTATFRSLQLTSAEGSGVSASAARSRTLGIDPILEAKYPAAVSAFEKYFGRHPTTGELMNLINHAGTDPNSLDSWLRAQPSHIPGVSQGMYSDVKGNLDSVSNKLFGHSGTDGMVKELVDQGKTSPTAVQFWLMQMDIQGKMNPNQYQKLYELNQPHMQALTNQTGYDPRISVAQHQVMQQQNVILPPPSRPPGAWAWPEPPRETIVQQQGAEAPGFR